MKHDVPLKFANRLINNGPVVLVSVKGEPWDNIMTLAWHMPLSHDPALIACAIDSENYTFELIKKYGEFVFNIPPARYIDEAVFCGSETGSEVNKFAETEFTKLPAKKIDAPIIKECVGHLELKLRKALEESDHSIVIAEVVAAYVDEDLFVNYRWDLSKVNLFHHLGGNVFLSTNGKIIYK